MIIPSISMDVVYGPNPAQNKDTKKGMVRGGTTIIKKTITVRVGFKIEIARIFRKCMDYLENLMLLRIPLWFRYSSDPETEDQKGLHT